MISKKLQDALNAQINAEMWSAYLYLSINLLVCKVKHFISHSALDRVILIHFLNNPPETNTPAKAGFRFCGSVYTFNLSGLLFYQLMRFNHSIRQFDINQIHTAGI